MMNTVTLERDMLLMYIDVPSFPDGIPAAQARLRALVPELRERSYFGISRPEAAVIRYRAAAEELVAGEAASLGLPTLLLRSGLYVSCFVPRFAEDISVIGRTFRELLQRPDIDPDGYCVEWYGADGQNVSCMLRLKDESS
ncbi:hypothetical protein GCM10028786_25130 [Flaviaesturariibacter terrae]